MRSLTHRGRAGGPSAPASTLLILAAALAVPVAISTETAAQGGVGGPVVVQPTQALATLLRSHMAMSAPDGRSAELQVVSARRPITGARTVLPIIGQSSSADGTRWLNVILPGRPNGHTGWIRRRATTTTLTGWHVVVDISQRRVVVYQQRRPVRVFKAVVGTPATPTPRGRFFVEEVVQLRAYDVGAPFAIALSARSNVLQEFAGGPGQIALHGRTNVGGVLGSAASHGCLRLDNDAMRWLVLRVGPGVPVTVTTTRR